MGELDSLRSLSFFTDLPGLLFSDISQRISLNLQSKINNSGRHEVEAGKGYSLVTLGIDYNLSWLDLVLLPLPGSVLLHVGGKLSFLFRSLLEVGVMSLEVSPQSGRLLEGFWALRALEVISVRVEHLVLLQGPGGEEPLAAGGAEEGAGHLLLRLVGVEGDHVSLEVGGHSDPLPTQVAVGVLGLGVLHHVELQLVLEVEDLLTHLTPQLGPDLVFRSDVNVAPSSLGIGLLTYSALELPVNLALEY